MTELLERMDAFFDSRLAGYDRHQRTEIAGAEAFYPLTASLLPREKGARVLEKTLSTLIQRPVSFESGLNWFQPCASFESGFTFAQ